MSSFIDHFFFANRYCTSLNTKVCWWTISRDDVTQTMPHHRSLSRFKHVLGSALWTGQKAAKLTKHGGFIMPSAMHCLTSHVDCHDVTLCAPGPSQLSICPRRVPHVIARVCLFKSYTSNYVRYGGVDIMSYPVADRFADSQSGRHLDSSPATNRHHICPDS